MPIFVVTELFLALAIPFMLIDGYYTFLGSNAGTFLADVDPADPGWRKLVEPTPVFAVLEKDSSEKFLQIRLVSEETSPLSEFKGYTFNVAPETVINGRVLANSSKEEVIASLQNELKVAIKDSKVVNPGEFNNGLNEIFGIQDAAEFKMLTIPVNDNSEIMIKEAESLFRSYIDLPVGAKPGDRLAVRVINRVLGDDVMDSALVLGSYGFEVSEIGNAGTYDQGETTMVVPQSLISGPNVTPRVTSEIERLADILNLDFVVDDSDESGDAVTILIGRDFKSSSN